MALFFYTPMMNPLMAGDAERHQVALVMRASLRKRLDMMDERRKDISALLFAHLTKRMPHQVTITNPAPYTAISGVLIVPTREVLVVSLHDFLVCPTVTAFSVCKVRTACHTTGAFWFSRHHSISIKKALAENCFSEKADSISYSC